MQAGLANLLTTVALTERRPARSWLGLSLYVLLACAVLAIGALL